jgi:hypothetical protein
VVIIGNGTLGPYSLVDASSVAIRLVSTGHLKLTRYAASTDDNNDGTVLVLNTDYTVGGTQDARTFTLISPQAVLTSSQRIVAERVQNYTQDLDLTTGGAFNATSLESRFDKLAEFQQELKAQLARTPKLQFADATANVAFPSPPTSSTMFLARNVAGEIIHSESPSVVAITAGYLVGGDNVATGDGTTTAFVLTAKGASASQHLDITIDGSRQNFDDYTTALDVQTLNTTVTFDTAPPSGAEITFRSRSFPLATSTISDIGASGVTATGSTTARTLAARFAEVANVLDFGAVGNGSTNDSTAVQAAASSLTAGGTLYFPPGRSYKLNTMITITASNVRVMCEGAIIDATSLTYVAGTRASGCVFKFDGVVALITTLAVSTVAFDRTAQLTSVTGAQVGDIIRLTSDKILYRNDTAITYYEDINRITAISGTTVTLEVPLTLDLTVSGQTVAVYIWRPVSNCSVIGGDFYGGGVTENLANGTGRCGVYFEGVAQGEVRGAIFRGFQGIAVLTESCADIYADDLTIYGIDEGVTITEGQNSGFYGVYFIRSRRGTATNINGIRVRHVIDGSDTFEMLQDNCRGSRTHRAAFGTHEGVHELVVSNCRATDCYAGGVVRAFTSTWDNNNFDAVTGPVITTSIMLATEAAGRLIIRGGKLRSRSLTLAAGVSVSGVFDPLIIDGVDMVTPSAGVYMACSKVSNLIVRNCTISGEGVNIVYPTGAENLDYISGVVIENNTFLNYTNNAVSIRGSELITAPADRIFIRKNTGIPVSSGNAIILRAEGWYGEQIEISDNTQLGDTSSVVSICPAAPWLIKSAPVVERNTESTKSGNTHRTIGANTSASYVSGATVLKGQVLNRSQPGTATIFGYIVTTAGTEGTLSGVTSSIDIGVSTTTVNLTGNSVSKVYPGCYITVAGAGVAAATLQTRITAVAADYSTATLETAASTTVVAAVTAYRAPVFTAFATTS